MRTAVLVAILTVLPLLGAQPAAAATVTVNVQDFSFSPQTVTISPGDTVRFVRSGAPHTVIFDTPGSPANCTPSSFSTCDRTFPTAGTYNYHCGVHPSMTGRTIVQLPAPTVVITAPVAGQDLAGSFVATGTASAASGLTITKVEAMVGSGPFQLATGTTAWSFTIDTTVLRNAAHTLSIRATDSASRTTIATVSFDVVNPSTIDLEVVSVAQTTAAGTSRTYTATVRNNGNTDVLIPSTGINGKYTYKGAEHQFATASVSVLGFSTTTVNLVWNHLGHYVGTFPVTIRVDPNGVKAETNEGNNAGSVTTVFFVNGISQDLLDPDVT